MFGAVDVDIKPGTRTAALLGDRVRVCCHHHQAIARLAPGLRVTGHAEDGTVEAVEVLGQAFAVGVQWHPEEDSEDTAPVRRARRRGARARTVPGTAQGRRDMTATRTT